MFDMLAEVAVRMGRKNMCVLFQKSEDGYEFGTID